MKKIFFALILAVIGCFGTSAQMATKYFNVGNPIKFCGTDFYFNWSANPEKNYYVQQYLPKGEKFESYKQMLTVIVIFWDVTPLDAVRAKIAELEQRKQFDPITNYTSAGKNGEYILEFIVSDNKNDQMNTVEVDVHHYKQMKINGKTASVLCFYSRRAYGNDIVPMIQSIPSQRNSWYDALWKLRLSPVFSRLE